MRTGGMSCTGFQQKPETNADRIRSMTDEELVKFLLSDRVAEMVFFPYSWVLNWLMKEAEDGNT